MGYFKYINSKDLKKIIQVFKSNLIKGEFGVYPILDFVENHWVIVKNQTDFRVGTNVWENAFYLGSLDSEAYTYEITYYQDIFKSLIPFFEIRGINPKIEFQPEFIIIEGEPFEMEKLIMDFSKKHTPGEFVSWLCNRILSKTKSKERVVATQMGEGESLLFLDKDLYNFLMNNLVKSKLNIDVIFERDVW